MYAKIGEFDSALHYVSAYISVKDDSPAAYRLQGQCYERKRSYDKALAAYQHSLQLNAKQPDLLIDVCKLILSDDLSLTPGKLRYWCDLADAEHVQHEAVINVKMKMLRRDASAHPHQMDEMLQRQIAQQPHNVTLRVQFVKHQLETDRLSEAFKYVYELDAKQHEQFANSIDWYATIGQVVARLSKNDLTSNWMYWLMAVRAAERQLDLTMVAAGDKSYPQAVNLTECTTLLLHLDQLLERAGKVVATVCAERELANHFMRHYRGQLCIHAATLIFKRESIQKTHWREVMRHTLPLLLLAWNAGVAANPADENWCRNSTEPTKQLLRVWRREGAFRSVQAGRTLLSCIDDTKDNTVMANIRKICAEKGTWTSAEELLAQIRQFCADNDWRRQLYRTLFSNSSEHMTLANSSHLTQCISLAEPTYQLPRVAELEAHEEIAQHLRPASLAHQVYLAMMSSAAGNNLADVRCLVFSGLEFSTGNLAQCGAESLNQLDVDAFLYAATIQAKAKLDMSRNVYESVNKGSSSANRPVTLPFANCCGELATDEQTQWWLAASRVFRNECGSGGGQDMAETRATIQYGIEAVRGVGAPKADMMVYLLLGQIFVVRAQDCVKHSDRVALEARAEAAYRFALHVMKMQTSRALEQFRRYFKYVSVNAMDHERDMNRLAEEAITFLAARYFRTQEFQECVDELAGIQLPFATYFQAEAYRKMDESSKTPRKNRRVYMEKAKDYLQQTLTLLEYPHVDKNHALKVSFFF